MDKNLQIFNDCVDLLMTPGLGSTNTRPAFVFEAPLIAVDCGPQ